MGLFTKTKTSKTFKVIDISSSPEFQYIPENKILRERLYAEKLSKYGVVLPDYDHFVRINLEKKDMLVLDEPFAIIFEYRGRVYRMLCYAGTCWDGSSVPTLLNFGRLSKVSPYSVIASLVHDTLWANKYFGRQSCDDIYEGLLEYLKCPPFIVWCYMFGLRAFGKKIFDSIDTKVTWLHGYSELVVDYIEN